MTIQIINAELLFTSSLGDKEFEVEIEDGIITSPADMNTTLHTEFSQDLEQGNIELY